MHQLKKKLSKREIHYFKLYISTTDSKNLHKDVIIALAGLVHWIEPRPAG